MKVDHIARAMVPWHEPATMTECGRPVDDVASLITRADLVEKIEQEGKQRALYSFCQTCLLEAIATIARGPIDTFAARTVAALRAELALRETNIEGY